MDEEFSKDPVMYKIILLHSFCGGLLGVGFSPLAMIGGLEFVACCIIGMGLILGLYFAKGNTTLEQALFGSIAEALGVFFTLAIGLNDYMYPLFCATGYWSAFTLGFAMGKILHRFQLS